MESTHDTRIIHTVFKDVDLGASLFTGAVNLLDNLFASLLCVLGTGALYCVQEGTYLPQNARFDAQARSLLESIKLAFPHRGLSWLHVHSPTRRCKVDSDCLDRT